ncbi:IclR family transcriptional regulator [Terrarubrum flagellatum]|uniref:IclR family transcriptional regulator n=1 Tax=Terrirubrum flagellatum TaxID=2895980 RepID=UPI003144FA59
MPRIAGQVDDGVQAVALTLRILEHISHERKAVGVTALAQALGTTKSRIFRHLQTLTLHGYLAQEPETERYHVGSKLISLGRQVSDSLDIVDIATPVLRNLRDTLGHYSVLSQVEHDGVRVLAAISGRSLVEIGVKRGSLLLYHASAQGKVALAYVNEEKRRQVLRSRLEMLTPYTIVSAVALEQELERVRTRGWAGGYNESLIGLNTLAAPVFDATGAIVATVGIVDSIQFIEETPSDDQIRETTGAAARISELLGYRARA